MRKFTLIFIGLLYILLGLYNLGLATYGRSYNIFLVVMGLMALGAADLGGTEGKWFDFAFGLVLIFLTLLGAYNLVYLGQGSLGQVIFHGLAATALLYFGITLNHRLKYHLK